MFILGILYIREYLRVLTKLFTGTQVSKDLQFRVSSSRNNQKRIASLSPYPLTPQVVGRDVSPATNLFVRVACKQLCNVIIQEITFLDCMSTSRSQTVIQNHDK